MSGHATKTLVSIQKKFLLSGVSSEYNDLAKFAEDTDSHLFGEELGDSLKRAKRRHYSLQTLKPRTNFPHASTKQKFHKTSKNDRPTKSPMACHKYRWPQLPKYMGRTDETIQQGKPIQASQTWEELKELQIKKLRAEIDFSINKMVSCHISMETLRADVEQFKGGNIANCFGK